MVGAEFDRVTTWKGVVVDLAHLHYCFDRDLEKIDALLWKREQVR